MEKYFPNYYNGLKIEFINNLDSEEIILIKTMDGLLLHPQTYEKYGFYGDWEDDDIPEEFKNSDDVVVDPDTGLELTEYTITEGCPYIIGTYISGSYEYDSDIYKDGLRDSHIKTEVHDFFNE